MVSIPITTPAAVLVHSTAIVEKDVNDRSQHCHLGQRPHLPLDADWSRVHCRVKRLSIAPGVRIGNRVKINASRLYLQRRHHRGWGSWSARGVIFTNDRYPRATTSNLKRLRSSEPDEHTFPTLVREGATIGAGSRIGCGLVIGRFAMVGMGSGRYQNSARLCTSAWFSSPHGGICLPMRPTFGSL